MTTEGGHYVAVISPNKPRPADPDIRWVADTLAAVERNYLREGSGPGSRFEGMLLEDVQAQLVCRLLAVKLLDLPDGARLPRRPRLEMLRRLARRPE